MHKAIHVRRYFAAKRFASQGLIAMRRDVIVLVSRFSRPATNISMCITSAFGVYPRHFVKILQQFGVHCNYHLLDEKMTTVYTDMLKN
jgi:hypothetical protein